MKYAIGIDVGGTAIKYGIVSEKGTIVEESIVSTPTGSSEISVVEQIQVCIQEMLGRCRTKKVHIQGIGIGIPGIVDKGVIIGCENLPELNGVILDRFFENYFNIPVFLENDANTMGISEIYFLQNKNIQDVVFLTIGTGIGGALVVNGNLYGGYRNRGTEFGHLMIDLNGPECKCGSRGCLEVMASIPALLKMYNLMRPEIDKKIPIDGKFIIRKYLDKEEEAIEAFDLHFKYISIGIASLINLFSPQKFIIGGGITESGDFYLNEIIHRVKKIVMKETSEFTVIERAKWGNKSGFLGAAALVFIKNE
jgi:glucokinase